MQKFLIINPVAGTSKSKRLLSLLPSIKKLYGNTLEILHSRLPGDIRKYCQQYSDQGSLFLIAGGDGSVNEAADGLRDSTSKLAVIPTGSGNGFARHIGATKPSLSLLKNLCSQEKQIKSDLGNINGKTFINVAGLGFDALIAKKFEEDGMRGLKTYLKHIFREFGKSKEFEFHISCDNIEHSGKAWMICIANGSEFGNGAKISPNSSITDGQLELIIVRKPGFYKIPLLVYCLLKGKIHFQLVQRLSHKEFKIELDRDADFQIDGEYIGKIKSAECSVKAGCLNLVLPGQNKNI